jgi:hypothetical protein
MWTRHLRSFLLALPFLPAVLLAGGSAQAAPQILGIVASNGLPTPLRCAQGYCSAYLASFCLQEARYAPNSGSEYHLAPGGRLTIVARLADGRSLRLVGDELLTIRTRSGFTALRVSLPEAKLAALGATSAAVEVGPGTTVLPRAYAGDPDPQSGEEVAAATGTLRRLAAKTFDRAGETADAARLIELVINRLSDQSAAPAVAGLWDEIARQAGRSGVGRPGIDAAAAVVAECQASGSDFASGVCLEMRQAELMTSLNRRFWDQAAGGS